MKRVGMKYIDGIRHPKPVDLGSREPFTTAELTNVAVWIAVMDALADSAEHEPDFFRRERRRRGR